MPQRTRYSHRSDSTQPSDASADDEDLAWRDLEIHEMSARSGAPGSGSIYLAVGEAVRQNNVMIDPRGGRTYPAAVTCPVK